MPKFKKLVCLDEKCGDILNSEKNYSKYIRDAIIFYDNSKKNIETVEATVPQPIVTELTS
ncbi:MAG: hypothetical protein COA77_02515 [Thaumarchaeota archaeon]|nr:MAG: hypothetical protein COA77_02515 [Nitrososphaerota archaeon]